MIGNASGCTYSRTPDPMDEHVRMRFDSTASVVMSMSLERLCKRQCPTSCAPPVAQLEK